MQPLVYGDGKSWHGVAGLSESTTGGAGVYGKNTGVGAVLWVKVTHGWVFMAKRTAPKVAQALWVKVL